MATTVDPDQTLGALVAEHPSLAGALERLRLDYCCDGDRTLAEACSTRGLDPDTVAVLLTALAVREVAIGTAAHDLRGATLDELCDHAVGAHHDLLRRELPRIAELVGTVVRVHGGRHPELRDVRRLFVAIASDLVQHIDREEATVFPAARALAHGSAAPDPLRALVAEHVAEHAACGNALAVLRDLAGGYEAETAYCATHRRLLASLEALELDVRRHVHEENNLLFPRLLAVAPG